MYFRLIIFYNYPKSGKKSYVSSMRNNLMVSEVRKQRAFRRIKRMPLHLRFTKWRARCAPAKSFTLSLIRATCWATYKISSLKKAGGVGGAGGAGGALTRAIPYYESFLILFTQYFLVSLYIPFLSFIALIFNSFSFRKHNFGFG